MCGITGIFDPELRISEAHRAGAVSDMATSISHRGPDDHGTWSDRTLSVGFRRLAIQDLSVAGRQPMVSHDGTLVLVFNGEVYNHLELRKELEARRGRISWRGHSDTETLLEVFCEWGLVEGARKLNGMFAMAVWSIREQTLWLVRDRLGKKPLYYGWQNAVLLFASELKAFRTVSWFEPKLDWDAAAEFFRFGYVPHDMCILDGFAKVPPGAMILIRRAGKHPPTVTRYYDILEDYVAAKPGGTLEDAADRIQGLLEDAVRRRLLADVPVGLFLSGGIDSSLVAALMRKVTRAELKSFAIGFDDPAFDERKHARDIAKVLGLTHRDMCVTEQDLLDELPRLRNVYDEPFGDSSQLPTVILSRFARSEVTVALSGDGGDELFGGYNHYRRYLRRRRRIAAVERWFGVALVRGVGGGLRRLADATGNRTIENAAVLLGGRQALYLHMRSQWRSELCVRSSSGWRAAAEYRDDLDFCQLADSTDYLPNDILVKVDRASMAASLEVRCPFLDADVVRASLQLPPGLRLQNDDGKIVLKRILRSYVPAHLVDRPKMGFRVPMASWLRRNLRPLLDRAVEEGAESLEPILPRREVERVVREHLSGEVNHEHKLWNIIVFNEWRSWFFERSAPRL